jgi:hypothetical protein
MTASAFAADVFYETRLHAGREALAAGRHLEAAENLRIACFGLLDTPASLSPCLAMLAVAQNNLGRGGEVDATLSRFVEVEKRFPSYDPASLDGGVRREFDTLIQKKIPRATLASLPRVAVAYGIARPAETKAPVVAVRPEPPASTAEPAIERPVITNTQPPATQPPPVTKPVTTTAATTQAPKPAATTTAATKPPVTTTTTTTKPPVTTTASKPPVTKPATQAPAKTASTPPVTKPATSAAKPSADPLGDARRLIADRKPAEAVRVLESALTQAPQRRDVRLALLQAAVFSADYRTGVAQIGALSPFRDSEAAYAFYAAVALYETGRRAEAKSLLTPIAGRLARSTWVDDYSKKILAAR